jgi:hypothetical protein
MVMYRKNKRWKTIHVSIDLKKMDELDQYVEKTLMAVVEETHLNRQWKAIDIVDVKIISSSYNPNKSTTFLDLLVFLADLTGEQID